MNFRICKKYCKMKKLEVSTCIDRCNGDSCNFVVFNMKGDGNRDCSFDIHGCEFTRQFADKMEQEIKEKHVREKCGHDFDPAFSTRRHFKLLDEIDVMKFDGGFYNGDYVRGCRYCEFHCIDYGKK